jgi:hypothetical protein
MSVNRCCYCYALAVGRFCFLNRQDEVVDNPFCADHSMAIYLQTQRSLETMHNTGTTARDFILRQDWDKGGEPLDLPATKSELLARGSVYIP